ncbi:MAG: hypothetical protein LBH54_03750 [Clostridiales bacterium]|nr:hypothetical protein [Clostridiales bacterium]
MSENFAIYRQQTERRLFAYNDLKAKLSHDISDLTASDRGASDPPEAATETDGIRRQIAETARELSRLDDALDAVRDDCYFAVIRMRYLEGVKDEDIAERVCCDVSTVRRNRKRILQRVAVRLYGAAAVARE